MAVMGLTLVGVVIPYCIYFGDKSGSSLIQFDTLLWFRISWTEWNL